MQGGIERWAKNEKARERLIGGRYGLFSGVAERAGLSHSFSKPRPYAGFRVTT